MAARPKTKPFTKMVGSGNDFVIFNNIKWQLKMPNKTAKHLLDRHFGIGSDQMLVILPSKKADFRLRIYNPDGSEAETCGNGLRCVAKYVLDEKMTVKKEISFETLGGIVPVKSLGKNFRVNMGEPLLKGKDIPVHLSGRIINRPLKLDAREFRITCISMGNPHCVIFVDDLDHFPVEKFGPLIETNHIFPKRTNVEFSTVTSREHIKVRTWERGAGETLSCGSGACATAVAAVLNGFTGREVVIDERGGKLHVNWDKESNKVSITGPAETVFAGEVEV